MPYIKFAPENNIETMSYLIPSLKTATASVQDIHPQPSQVNSRMETHSSPRKELVTNDATNSTKLSKEPRSQRGKNFMLAEDKALSVAWANATQDPIVGTDQSSNEFFNKVHKKFSEYWVTNGLDGLVGETLAERGRTVNGLKTRFKSLT